MARKSHTESLKAGFKLNSKERSYEIVKVLGSGSFGITYEVKTDVTIGNISTSMRFAIKEHFISASCYRDKDGAKVCTVPTAQSDINDSREDFLREANRLKKICQKSRNIVSVNETFEANGTAYYVMEFLDGGSPSKCSEEDAVALIIQIADALKEIHNENVLHLDLKPDNIVLKTNDKGETYPVVIDFGISKHFDSKGRPTSSLNAKGASPGYAPQEQYAGVSEFSPKYDIYALGAVLFFLVSGKNPPDAFDISPNQQELKKELDGKVSANVEKTILNAMKPSAADRTPSIQQFLDDLQGIDFVPLLNVESSQLDFDKGKDEKSLLVKANIGWTVFTDAKWCKVEKKGDILSVKVDKNKDKGNRNCEITINGAPYELKRKIVVKQKGSGTVVFSNEQSWWNKNSNKIYQGIGALLIIGLIVGIIFIIVSSRPSESQKLSEAIENKDEITLKEYINKDSLRAFIPYAEILANQQKYYEALKYAKRALNTPDSLRAKGFIEGLIRISSVNLNSTQPAPEADTVVAVEVIGVDEQSIPQKTETNDEKFARAKNDFNLMLSLAKDNYAKAFYPLAEMYYNKKDNTNARLWAVKALDANIDVKASKSLIEKIDSDKIIVTTPVQTSQQTTSSSLDEKEKRLQAALKDPAGFSTLLILAEQEQYPPSYYHYARQLLLQGKTAEAKRFLKLSITKGANVSQSRQLLEALED